VDFAGCKVEEERVEEVDNVGDENEDVEAFVVDQSRNVRFSFVVVLGEPVCRIGCSGDEDEKCAQKLEKCAKFE